MIIADFHIHSTFSDGKLTIPEIVDFYGTRGFGAIAVTDHVCPESGLISKAAVLLGHCLTPAKFVIYKEILATEKKRAWDQYRMVLFPGVEISQNTVSNRRSAHILSIGADEWISADGDAVDIARQIHHHGGVAVAAHPVSTRKLEKQTYHLWDRRDELRTVFDAWEVASGPHLFTEVLSTRLPKLANSDLHSPKQMSSWKTVFECERHPEAILDAIKKQDLHFKFYEDDCPNELLGTVLNGARTRRSWFNPLGGMARS